MIGEGELSTANILLVLREERRDRQIIRDDANNAKLGGIVNNLVAPDRRPRFLDDRTGYYGNRYSTSSYRILSFLCAHYDVTPPLTSKTNMTDALSNYPYITDSDTDTEYSSLHVTMKCGMSSSTSLKNPSPLTSYVTKPSSIKD